MATHFFELDRLLHEVLDGVHRTDGVADRPLCMLAGFEHRLDRYLKVAQVVHGVEDTEHVHAVVRRFLYKRLDHVIRIVAVAEQVLAAQQHLDGGVGQGFF